MTPAQPTTVRAAVPEDASAIATIRVRSWQAAYRGLLPQGFLDSMDPRALSERLRVRLAGRDNPFTTRVAERAGKLTGFATTGPYRCDDGEVVDERTGEILAIYVHPDHWSTGAGRALMTDALATLATAGLHPVLLWVLRDNARARRFYERAGFTADGAEELYDAGGVSVPEIRYRYG